MKVALVHDYLLDYGGAERVLYELHKIFPQAPIYVSLVDKKGMGKFWEKFENIDIRKSWFGNLPFSSKLISPLRFLLPFIWENFSFTDYDLVITSASWAVTKGMKKGDKTKEICYLHTPPRYLYGYDTSRKWEEKWYGALITIYATIINHFMRMYDFKSAQKVDYFIVNSKNVGERVEKFYRRSDYQVIYPPVDVEKIIKLKKKVAKDNYFLTGGRMVASKNFDLIIKACKKAKVNLKIFGTGTEGEKLSKPANYNVEFLGRISDEQLIAYYKGAKAFILAQSDEDFGITPIEAAAAGCPSIAYKGGGYLESVVEGKTGVFFDELSVDSLAKTIKNFNLSIYRNIKPSDCIEHAKKFSKERFVGEINKFVANRM